MKTIDGETVVSIKAVKAIIEKYKLRPDGDGNYQIKQWMVAEMVAWDRANNTGPDKVKPN
jgi:hypothetical protein